MAITLSSIVTVRPRLTTIVRAAIASQLKMPSIGDTFLRRSFEFERYRSSMIGDIAKLAAKEWLEHHRFAVTDWDDVRTSWRSSRKLFDLQINNCAIEIASSIELLGNISRKRGLSQILAEKHIIQPIRRTRKDIVLQAYFISDNNPSVHLMGWVEWDNLIPYRAIRHIAGRPRDFCLVPFSENVVRPMTDLIAVLRTWT